MLSRLPIILNSLTTSLKDEAIEYLEKEAGEGRDFPYRISYQPTVANGEDRAILDLGFVGQSDNYSETEASRIFFREFFRTKDIDDQIAWFVSEGINVSIDGYMGTISFEKRNENSETFTENY